MVYEGFEWLTRGLSPHERIVLTSVALGVHLKFEVDSTSFGRLFRTAGPLSLQAPEWQRTFERYFLRNLTPGVTCSVHQHTVTFDHVTVRWAETTEFDIVGCCEHAVRAAFATMCAFDPDKDYG